MRTGYLVDAVQARETREAEENPVQSVFDTDMRDSYLWLSRHISSVATL